MNIQEKHHNLTFSKELKNQMTDDWYAGGHRNVSFIQTIRYSTLTLNQTKLKIAGKARKSYKHLNSISLLKTFLLACSLLLYLYLALCSFENMAAIICLNKGKVCGVRGGVFTFAHKYIWYQSGGIHCLNGCSLGNTVKYINYNV